jgi:glycosyltransferase involved in cell wall biosynthesis
VVILTSLERSIEGSPNAILEAMAMGRPVVASNVGGIPEIITDGMEGYLVHPDDSQGFAARITSIVQQPLLRAALGQAGRATILERFSERCAMQALTDALNRFGAPVSSAQSLGA